ncbi:MAG: molybdopterin-dependent oxidoreductase [Kiritimatiellia bacterium]|nr:molybdopterin-dependent oxidoreductase [Pseudomonadales bacterium]MDP6469400.1 molybdopterin-dependent oxidoreductase [Pseudomonadales bacterium]MDP6828981.1 molybdopterin-dependent oxidoreductase [Pseudomonadales bacterium]MDP7024687.1 molybdopterin-dependent oxidoreductase [Kiritimatiellia bacterium]
MTNKAQDYRDRWSWARVTFGTHCLNCLATCPYRVYSSGDEVLFEEPAGLFEQPNPNIPDMNPMACQKGSAWSQQLDGPDRLTVPLRRAGERGEGSWEEISWEEAMEEIAEAVVEAIDMEGPESVVFEETVEGGLLTQAAYLRFASQIGAVTLDANGLINDFPSGHHITFGKFSCASSQDDTFNSEVILIWHSNPVYTAIPYAHFITEARYNGSRVVTIAPDYSASAVVSDEYVPIKAGTDAAFALAMCQVMVSEGLVNEAFVKSQTDLPLLVNTDTRRFVRGSDIDETSPEDQFYWWDATQGGMAPAPRGSLLLGDADPALTGTFELIGRDGEKITATTVYELMLARLADYTPELASEICGVNPDTIRALARQIASKRTKIMEGFNTAKYYHGDLMERAMCLVLALSGNWGREGTGIQGLALAGMDGYTLWGMKQKRGVAEAIRVMDGVDDAMEQLRKQNPDSTDEMIGYDLLLRGLVAGTASPPAFFHYYHCGYDETWNNKDWSDPEMKRSFEEYLQDSIRRGWWGGLVKPGPGTEPTVFFSVATNPVRRQRGGGAGLLESLWPKLEKIVVVENRMSATALQADIVLPAAMQYERPNLQYAITHSFSIGFSEAAVPPKGDAKTEWEIFHMLSKAVEEKAEEMGCEEYQDARKQPRTLEGLGERFTSAGVYVDEEDILDEWLQDSVEAGTLPRGASLATLREKGTLRFNGLGMFAPGLSLATDIRDDQPVTAYTWHVEKGVPFPTLTRRAQFLIDHPWFAEADEDLVKHKNPPMMGGDYPLLLTSGHSRWSIHASSMGNRVLAETHRAEPLATISKIDAAARGIEDGDLVEMKNDRGSARIRARVSGRIHPGQVVVYNGWEPHMFENWQGPNDVEPGMVKWLHLVSRYGHLRYMPFGWQPVPADRAVFIDVKKVGTDA